MQTKVNLKTTYQNRPQDVDFVRVGDLAIITITENVVGVDNIDLIDNIKTTHWEVDEYVFEVEYSHGLEDELKNHYELWLSFAKDHIPQQELTEGQRIVELESIVDMLIINALGE